VHGVGVVGMGRTGGYSHLAPLYVRLTGWGWFGAPPVGVVGVGVGVPGVHPAWWHAGCAWWHAWGWWGACQ